MADYDPSQNRRPRPDGGPHRSFVDMTGTTIGQAKVVSRAPNAESGNVCWNLVCQKQDGAGKPCGARFTFEGIQLRAILKSPTRAPKFTCPGCRAKRRGTYTRRAHG